MAFISEEEILSSGPSTQAIAKLKHKSEADGQKKVVWTGIRSKAGSGAGKPGEKELEALGLPISGHIYTFI